MVKLLGETVWQFFKKLNMLLKYDSSAPLLGQYPKEMKVCVHTNVCNSFVCKAPNTHHGRLGIHCAVTTRWAVGRGGAGY